ncbi:MAG TPA: PD-(D/E)XK nuclease family protein [Bryobacteraceae bacterium]|nr:PD-(D/E)XK nuclease family protein [Bryobacteraceae bacterium]
MHEGIFRALESGATVITASRRLARVLTEQFHGLETARGRMVWNRPDILPLEGFLDRAWRDWLWRAASSDAPVLLNAAQEQALWERIIRTSPLGESLLQIPETARQAAQTWQLVVAYRLAVDGSFEASDDTAAFAEWSREFSTLCGASDWLERARLSDFLRPKIASGEAPRPSEVYVAGFDEMTPQQVELFAALGEWRTLEIGEHASAPERRKLRDSSDEIRSAAAWARKLLESDPKAQIGAIVVPDLTRSRSVADRIFRQTLGRAAHLSVGPPLGDYPVVRAALLMLDFAQGALPLSRAGMLLRSPFLGGAEGEWSGRAQLDAKLRRHSLWDIDIAALRDAAGNCPQLQRALRRVEKKLRNLLREQTPSAWSSEVAGLLDAFGWPGDRTLSSVEFQTIEAWRGLLAALASLDLTATPMNLAQVTGWLRESAASTQFQPEDEGAPMQVMGMLEAAGLRFDHLWIMGLHDEALPAPANPNPFLPSALQRQRNLPHSSAARELDFARTMMDRLLRSAPDVVLSYPEREGDRALGPSPLVTGGLWLDDGDEHTDDWIVNMRASAAFEEIADEAAPALVQGDSTGGAGLFKDMAACPFRAFAKHRLGARPMEDPDLGLSYRDRGTTVHKALEVIWRELGSHARLVELSSEDVDALIARGADAAVAKLGPGIGRDLEKRRLQKLLREWLAMEKLRPEFSVAGIEAERVVTISGVRVKMRADRVDELPGGREIILDYKTGQLKSKGWDGDRPDEPQLPLYCVTNERPVAGAAFAAIRTGDVGFYGLTAAGTNLPGMKNFSKSPVPFERQLDEWRRVLEQLATDYRDGRAEVDPKSKACDNCGLRGLCRIREFEHDRR